MSATAPSSPPSREEIRAARLASGLKQDDACQVIHAAVRTWQDWECGRSKMHPAFFELFLLKTGQRSLSLPASVPAKPEAASPAVQSASVSSLPDSVETSDSPISQFESDENYPGIIPWGGIDD
jgi:transcriptional regulator with XRE-family HTH domain